MNRVIEIRAGEGGKDSRNFVQQLAETYERLCDIEGWTFDRL